MASGIDSWQIVRRLGAGGQGTVDLVITPARHAERRAAIRAIVESIEFITPHARDQNDAARIPSVAEHLAAAVEKVNRPDLPTELGALKQLRVPDGPAEHEQAMGRFSAEVRALRELHEETAVLRLLDADEAKGWMVTHYHERGTLQDNPRVFAGDALRALRAFEPLVAAIARLHQKKVIHRDIKPANVFRSSEYDLVLGDFGIVFWTDERQLRMTETYERVGSRDWMAPWANRGRRLADVNPTFDLFPLGKLLWSMLSGQHELPYWYWRDDEHNLERLFPDSPGMSPINARILAHTVVEREAACLKSADELQIRVKEIISQLECGGQRVSDRERPCRVCGIGHYKDFRGSELQIIGVLNGRQAERLNQAEFVYKNQETRMTIRVQVCDNCGHAEFFHFPDGNVPPAWTA